MRTPIKSVPITRDELQERLQLCLAEAFRADVDNVTQKDMQMTPVTVNADRRELSSQVCFDVTLRFSVTYELDHKYVELARFEPHYKAQKE